MSRYRGPAVATARPTCDPSELAALLAGEHTDPHHVLGIHPHDGGWVVRARHPAAVRAAVAADGAVRTMRRVHDDGLFELVLEDRPTGGYRIEWRFADGSRANEGDPYRFPPTLGDLDLYLLREGRHERLWEVLGARPIRHEGVEGVAFSVWAPNARAVRVVGDHNGWDGRRHPMRNLGASGFWEIFVPLLPAGTRYKYELVDAAGRLDLRADPVARRAEAAPGTASVVLDATPFPWGDAEWLAARAVRRADDRLAIYEVHLGSWCPDRPDGNGPCGFRDVADRLADHVEALGFTHVELLPVAEHPYGGSWGYQVTGYYAPAARYGSPDDLRHLVDTLHRRGIGVLLDWVPAHFPRDAHALARFDGTPLYEHPDPRRADHPDWGTLTFDYGRPEVRNFLVANARYWVEEFHVDGIRVDAVASMLYLDYSRPHGAWAPNEHGGRENLEAVAFLRELNDSVHAHHPGVLTVAEESTAWPRVTGAPADGGLGFDRKWNLGWMHDTLRYTGEDPLHRRHHHDLLTFGLWYAWEERFVLPLGHDEVVHGKGSLLGRMPGDDWQRFATLRALYGWMWAHPGAPLLFMGGELAQPWEWDESGTLGWHLLDDPAHLGVAALVAELNAVHATHPALWRGDDDPAGFRWLDVEDRESSVFAFLRSDAHAARPTHVVTVANFTPVPRDGRRVGVPTGGRWVPVLGTDDVRFGGTGRPVAGSDGVAVAEDVPWQGCPASIVVDVPPLAVTWFAPEEVA